MLFVKTAIAILAAATLASARPYRMFETEMCHWIGEPCDRQDQCCPGLRCDLDRYECLPADPRAHNKVFDFNEMCHFIGEPCDRQDQCCPGLRCDIDNYECAPRQLVQKKKMNSWTSAAFRSLCVQNPDDCPSGTSAENEPEICRDLGYPPQYRFLCNYSR